jgi:hypothetical protein
MHYVYLKVIKKMKVSNTPIWFVIRGCKNHNSTPNLMYFYCGSLAFTSDFSRNCYYYFKFIRMKRLTIISIILFLISFHSQAQSGKAKSPFMIRHTVVLKLKYPKGSPEESEFLVAAAKLASIPGVHKFESLRQVSKNNDFELGFSMEFESLKAYDNYSQHPDHTRFVESYWSRYVDKFLEIDYEPIK